MPAPVVDIKALSYSYPDGTTALDGLIINIIEGERIVLLGNNGAGKSTLLLHLNGLLPSPSVSVFGHFTSEKATLPIIRQKVGLVFQNPDDQLFCPTIAEDVAFGPRNMGLPEEIVQQHVKESLAAVGIPPELHHRSAFHLSLGQKKRVAIATVLAMQVEMLVLDEPTSNLDLRGRRELATLLNDYRGTLLIATHDFAWASMLCPRAILLEQGRLLADGPTPEVIRQFEQLA